MVATEAELEAAIAAFAQELQKGIRIEAILLFGSYASGTPHPWSDIDLAVISPDFEDVPMWKRQRMIASLSVYHADNISPIGYPSSEYYHPDPHSFLREILRTGKVVYSSQGKRQQPEV